MMGFITIWLNPTDKYVKTYRDHLGNVTRTAVKTIREYYEQVVLHANKNPDITAKIVQISRPGCKNDGHIAVDVSIKRTSFTSPIQSTYFDELYR